MGERREYAVCRIFEGRLKFLGQHFGDAQRRGLPSTTYFWQPHGFSQQFDWGTAERLAALHDGLVIEAPLAREIAQWTPKDKR